MNLLYSPVILVDGERSTLYFNPDQERERFPCKQIFNKWGSEGTALNWGSLQGEAAGSFLPAGLL